MTGEYRSPPPADGTTAAAPLYEVQAGPNIDGYRVTEIVTDSRIATCYARENAELVVAALNAYATPATSRPPRRPAR